MVGLSSASRIRRRWCGGASLVVLHDRRQAASILDRVIELSRGSLVAASTLTEELTGFAGVRLMAEGGR